MDKKLPPWVGPESPYGMAIEAVLGALTPSELAELLFDFERFQTRLRAHIMQALEHRAPRQYQVVERELQELIAAAGTTPDRPEL